jgi:RNA polymerase sigma-70 factor (ECF subfamily)
VILAASAPAPAPSAPRVPSFEEVAETCLDPVFRFLAHLVGDRHLAEDLTADTFERALRAWASYDPERGTPVAWLVGIARRIAFDHFRSERRRRDRESRWAATEPVATGAPAGPGGLSPVLRSALAALPPAERELVALRVVLGLDTREAAAIVGSTPTAVSTQLHRTMTRLRKEVTPDAVA